MRIAAALALLALPAGPALAGDRGAPIAVPSGMHVTHLDVIRDAAGNAGPTLRFRFVAPAIAPGGGVPFAQAAADMQHLCDTFALPRALTGPAPARIVIALSDRPVPFGAAAPEATQFIEVFAIEGAACRWEPF